MKSEQVKAFEELAAREQDQQRDTVQRIVRSVARGNINLQLGRYITERDKEAMRTSVRNYVIKMPE